MATLGFICAFAIGIILGLLGGGGSILGVPTLVYLFKIPASTATSYSLFIVGITSLAGALSYLRKNQIHFRAGLAFLVPSLVGILISRRWILPSMPPDHKDRIVLLGFGIVMAIAAYSMLRKKPTHHPPTLKSLLEISLYALGAGLLMGFVGAGGGFLIVPVLVGLAQMDMKRAVGTSLFIITLNTLGGFTSDYLAGLPLDWRFLFIFSGLSVAGVLIGSALSRRVPSTLLKSLFGWMVATVSFFIVASELAFMLNVAP